MPRTTITTKVTLRIWKLTVLSSAALVWALSYYSWHRWFDPDGLTPCPTIGARCQASPSLWSFLLQEAHTIFFLMGQMQSNKRGRVEGILKPHSRVRGYLTHLQGSDGLC